MEKIHTGTAPVVVHCWTCDHEWVVVYTPIRLDAFIQICQSAHCPKCGASGRDILCGSAPKKPTMPLNRVLREGETPCAICGSGRADHAKRDHAYTRQRPKGG